jgi:hypothetical protein
LKRRMNRPGYVLASGLRETSRNDPPGSCPTTAQPPQSFKSV